MKLLVQGESVLPNDSLINPSHHLYQWALQKQLSCCARYATFHACCSEGSILENQPIATARYFPTESHSKRIANHGLRVAYGTAVARVGISAQEP
jgi:hypothetical protein